MSTQLLLSALLNLTAHAGFSDILAVFPAAAALMVGLSKGRPSRQGQGSNGNQKMAHFILREAAALITGMSRSGFHFRTSPVWSSAMSELVIRAAEPSDTALILALLEEFAAYAKAPEFKLNETDVLRDMFGGACHCELAFREKEPVGIACWYWTYKSFRAARGLFVEDLYVREAFRGQGLGKALLAHLAAKARGAGGFLEWQVLDWNSSAISFYKMLGAQPLGQWLNYRLDGEPLERLAQSETR
nr:Acetyltransferase (GNAT) family [uncultured bacterium]